VWEPRRQRPEFRNIFNTKLAQGETMRVFPLSNWTELDIFEYVRRGRIPIVPLYFAAQRPIVDRGGTLIMVDDDRMTIGSGEKVEYPMVRFRTLGCYPLTGAVRSSASTLEEVIAEIRGARASERQGRVIDTDDVASMERKKREGYF
jgi:sulfate adenylyltransferase subunit 2